MLRAVAAGAVGGNVIGAASSTNNAIARFDGVSGRLLKDTSGATISDNFALTLAGATVTASEPVLNLTQTWNNAAVAFTAAQVNVTNTLSAATSLLADFKVGNVSLFSVGKGGEVNLGDGSIGAPILRFASDTDTGMYRITANTIGFIVNGTASVAISSSLLSARGSIGLASSVTTGSPDIILARDAAAAMGQRDGTNAQTSRIYRTYTNGSNYERQALQSGAGYFEWAAETAGTGTDDIDLRLTPSTTTAAVDFRNPANGAAAQLGTLTNAPTAGNPAYWLKIRIGGTTHYIPAWT